MLAPDIKFLIPSKWNARFFHEEVKHHIYETGEGLWEYLEFLKFISKLQDQISGDYDPATGRGTPGDVEFKKYVRSEIEKYEGAKFTSPRGVKFETMEAGIRYDYTKCGDPIYEALAKEMEVLQAKVKERQEFLRAVPKDGLDVLDSDSGELVKVYPPSKTSTSTYKITLPK